MMKKYKSLIVTLAVVIGVVITSVIFCFTLFTVKDVKLDFRTDITSGYTEQEIIEKSGIGYGQCVFFLKKSKVEENIEKNFPYLEVINIETVIPSHIIFHLAEREDFYAIVNGGQTIYCDDEFKVLRIEEGNEYDSISSNAILLKNVEITNSTISAGDFLKIKQNGLYDLYDSMLLNARKRPEMLALCKEIAVTDYSEKEVIKDGKSVEKEWQTSIRILTHEGREIFIGNAEYGLEYKLSKVFAVMSSVFEIDKFSCDTDADGQKETYNTNDVDIANANKAYEILSKVQIHVENYQSEYVVDEATGKIVRVYDEKDNYFYLTYNGQLLEKAN